MSEYRSRSDAACALVTGFVSALILVSAGQANAGEWPQGLKGIASAPESFATKGSAPAQFFTINEILAQRTARQASSDQGQGGSAQSGELRAVTPASTAFEPRNDEPFGLYAFRAPDGPVSAKWQKVEADINHDLAVMATCRRQPEQCNSPAAARFNAIIDEARRHEGFDRLAGVNRAVNVAISYMTDFEQYSVVDLWSSPLATFATGRGDCEDYAIAKYVALRESGVPERELRILLVHDSRARDDHAILAARQDGKWLVLDNRFTQLPTDHDMWNFEPVYAISQDGVKLLARPFDKNLVADGSAGPAKSAAARVAAPEHAGKPAGGWPNVIEAGNLRDTGLLAA